MVHRQRVRIIAPILASSAVLVALAVTAPAASAAVDPLPAMPSSGPAPAPAAALAASPAPLLGFDTSSAPSAGTMQAWLASPYRAVGVYLRVESGSDNRFDKVQANLTSGWVSQVRTMGWSLMPVYLGKQAPAACQPRVVKYMSADPTTAAAEGSAAANDAISSVSQLGLPAGSPIYYDMEAYNPGCSAAVLAFLSAWSSRLQSLGYLPGVYGSRASVMTDLTNAISQPGFTTPSAVWVATGNGSTSVFGLGTPPDVNWNNRQRIHQYRLNVTESYGSVPINIDSNAVDGPVVPPTNPPTPTSPGAFASVTPARVLDTRVGHGGSTATPNGTLSAQVLGQGGVPGSGVAAVAINVTAVNPAAGGYLTVWPSGAPQPNASNLNFVAGQTVPNMVVVPVGADGRIQLFNGSPGPVDLLADVAGYYLAGAPTVAGAFAALSPARVLDTRVGHGGSTATPNGTLSAQVLGQGGVPGSGVAAVAINVTAVNPAAGGYLTVWPSGAPQPNASNLNFVAGQTVPNMVVVPVGADGRIQLFNGSPGPVDLLADVAGYYLAGAPTVAGAFAALTPARVLDTRVGQGGSAVGGQGSMLVQVGGLGGVPGSGVAAVALNVTAVGPAAPGYATVWPPSAFRPNASNLNFAAGQNVPNMVVVPVRPDGRVQIFNGSSGSLNLLVDVTGYYRSA